MLARRHQLLIVAAQWRTAISGDEACGVQPCRAVAADLRHRQAHQSLNARQKDMTGFLSIFLIETDRTLVDSHSALFSLWQRFKAKHAQHLEPVYVAFRALCTTNFNLETVAAHFTISFRNIGLFRRIMSFRLRQFDRDFDAEFYCSAR